MTSTARGASVHTVQPTPLKAWLLAARPQTLTIAVAPVLIGTALALAESGRFDALTMTIALFAAILIQVGTNLQNDVGDFRRGADGADRLGPPRATSQGWLPAARVARAARLAFELAFVLGAYLVWTGGWPILLIGIVSIAAGMAYTSGRRPIAYTGLGELFVFAFFGLIAVGGSYYLQAASVGWSAPVAGAMIGMLAAAVLAVNNYRDIESDRRAGKHTLAACLGARFARAEYGALVLAPFVLLPVLGALANLGSAIAFPLLLLPWAVKLVWQIHARPSGAWLNRLLAETALLEFALAITLTTALLLQRTG